MLRNIAIHLQKNGRAGTTVSPKQSTEVHRFLHVTCANTRVAQIIVNGHGSPIIGNDGSAGDDGNPCNGEHQGGRLCVHSDGHVENATVVSDISKCFSSIHPNSPPYQVVIVFAQCFAEENVLCSENPDVVVTCLVKAGQCETWGSFSEEHKSARQINLSEYAEDRKAQRACQSNGLVTSSTNSIKQ